MPARPLISVDARRRPLVAIAVSVIAAHQAALLAGCEEAGTAPSTAATRAADLPVAATAASWPLFRGDPRLTGVAPGSIVDSPVLLWTYETGGHAIASSPVVADGRVFFGADDGFVHAVDFETGASLWTFESEDIIEAPPLIHDGRVYIGSSDMRFYALDAESGSVAWTLETDERVLGGANCVTAPDGSGTWILVGSYDNKLYCVDAVTGAIQWTYETDNYVNGTPAIVGDAVVFGGCDSALHVVDIATGEPRKKVQLCPDCHIAGSVAVRGDTVYFGHYGNAFVAVDMNQAEVIWTYESGRFPFFSAPAIGTDRIVFGGRDKALHCANLDDGAPLWTFKTRRKVDGSPIICGDKVVFGSGDGQLYIVSLADGRELWSYDVGRSIFSSPAVAGGVILVGAHDGRLYAFGPESARPASMQDSS
jgi:outer membrane protein assembly factor BamB